MIGLDFETYCELDLKKVGLDNYVSHPSFQVLLAATMDDEPASQPTCSYNLLPDYYARRSDLTKLKNTLQHRSICAHNSGFEAACLRFLFPGEDLGIFWADTAMMSRMAGGSSSLEKAAKQFLDHDVKMPEGKRLIKKFCTGPECPKASDVLGTADWSTFVTYCIQDARLTLVLHNTLVKGMNKCNVEFHNQRITDNMNVTGWHVDLESVNWMLEVSQINKDQALEEFHEKYQPDRSLNVNSLKQLKEWCAARGVRATSFAEDAVATMLAAVDRRIAAKGLTPELEQVAALLQLKQILGGSSLSKLPKILDLTGPDGRLRHQYMHAGAGQTGRTSGTGVQMQNLKRLDQVLDLDDKYNLGFPDNETLAGNVRQLFTAEHPYGALIVGDFSSVESRGLAYLAGEEWKLAEYRKGRDMYKVLAAKNYGIDYEQVNYDQRRFGKVGELSCGYGAGASAVQSFADGMGVKLTLDEAQKVVNDWRNTNPKIVQFWKDLDAALQAMPSTTILDIGCGHYTLQISFQPALDSIQALHPGAQDARVTLTSKSGKAYMTRIFRGVYRKGRQLVYHKPSSAMSGPVWKDNFVDPKTKRSKHYTIYGGKLAGILTQSFCREIFFDSLWRANILVNENPGLKLVGQFHDEIVVEYNPDGAQRDISEIVQLLKQAMEWTEVPNFPLAAEINYSHRYIK